MNEMLFDMQVKKTAHKRMKIINRRPNTIKCQGISSLKMISGIHKMQQAFSNQFEDFRAISFSKESTNLSRQKKPDGCIM